MQQSRCHQNVVVGDFVDDDEGGSILQQSKKNKPGSVPVPWSAQQQKKKNDKQNYSGKSRKQHHSFDTEDEEEEAEMLVEGISAQANSLYYLMELLRNSRNERNREEIIFYRDALKRYWQANF